MKKEVKTAVTGFTIHFVVQFVLLYFVFNVALIETISVSLITALFTNIAMYLGQKNFNKNNTK